MLEHFIYFLHEIEKRDFKNIFGALLCTMPSANHLHSFGIIIPTNLLRGSPHCGFVLCRLVKTVVHSPPKKEKECCTIGSSSLNHVS